MVNPRENRIRMSIISYHTLTLSNQIRKDTTFALTKNIRNLNPIAKQKWGVPEDPAMHQ